MSRRERQKRRRRSRGHPVTRVLMVGSVLAVCGAVLAVLAGVGWVVAVADSGPNLTELRAAAPSPLTQIFASDGSSLGYVHSDTIYNSVGNRIPTQLSRRRSRSRTGASTSTARSITRASCAPAVKDIVSGADSLQGASTLTMQLVDNKYLPAKIAARHNLKYKIIQAKLAEQLEHRRSKGWILDNYLNDVPYGTVGGQTAYRGRRRRPGVLLETGVGAESFAAGADSRPTAGAVPVQPVPAPVAGPQAPRRRVARDAGRRTTSTPSSPPWPTASRSACTRTPGSPPSASPTCSTTSSSS